MCQRGSSGRRPGTDPERAPLVRRAFEEYATGRFTKEQLLKQTGAWGLTNRRGRPLTSQAIGTPLRNRLYAGIVDVPEYGVRTKRGDFEPLISEDLFYRVQAVLSGRVPSTTPQQRAHPDFPLRAFVRCESCGRGLTGSWSKETLTARNGASRRRGPNRISGSARSGRLSAHPRTQRGREAAKVAERQCVDNGQRCDPTAWLSHQKRDRCRNPEPGSCFSARRRIACLLAWSSLKANQMPDDETSSWAEFRCEFKRLAVSASDWSRGCGTF